MMLRMMRSREEMQLEHPDQAPAFTPTVKTPQKSIVVIFVAMNTLGHRFNKIMKWPRHHCGMASRALS